MDSAMARRKMSVADLSDTAISMAIGEEKRSYIDDGTPEPELEPELSRSTSILAQNSTCDTSQCKTAT